jgi:hypothetical protein
MTAADRRWRVVRQDHRILFFEQGADQDGEFGHRAGCAGAEGNAGFDGKPHAAFVRTLGSGFVEPVAGTWPATGGDGRSQGCEGCFFG